MCRLIFFRLFYTSEDSKGYNLSKYHVYSGLTYVTSYTTFPNENKKWFRVRVLQVSDSNEIVKVSVCLKIAITKSFILNILLYPCLLDNTC